MSDDRVSDFFTKDPNLKKKYFLWGWVGGGRDLQGRGSSVIEFF